MSKNAKEDIISRVKKRNPNETEFLQAVKEVMESVSRVWKKHPEYYDLKILERMIEPERIISFRVCWQDDKGETHVNRGFRVQMDSAMTL